MYIVVYGSSILILVIVLTSIYSLPTSTVLRSSKHITGILVIVKQNNSSTVDMTAYWLSLPCLSTKEHNMLFLVRAV